MLKREGFLARDARIVERKKAGLHKARKAPSSPSASRRARRGAPLLRHRRCQRGRRRGPDPQLVERLGRAATIWIGGGAVFIGRDTRGSGPELERAFASGVASAGGNAVLAGDPPDARGCVARARPRRRHLRVAQPARVQRRQVLRPRRAQAHRRQEEEIEALLDAEPRDPEGGQIDDLQVAVGQLPRPRARPLRPRPRRAAGRSRLRQRRVLVDRAAGVRGARRRGRRDRVQAGRHEHQRRLRRDRPAALQELVTRKGSTSASRSTATATGCSRSTRTATRSTATRSSPILALDLGVDTVVVTTMTNLGFHRLMEERGIRGRHDRCRRPLRARGARARGRRCSAASSPVTSSISTGTSPATGSRPALLLCGAVERAAARRARCRDAALPAGEGERSRRAARAE